VIGHIRDLSGLCKYKLFQFKYVFIKVSEDELTSIHKLNEKNIIVLYLNSVINDEIQNDTL
jgi:hypothetical protein